MRLNLSYKGDTFRRLLERVKQLGHHGTDHAAIAQALTVYGVILEERAKGNKIRVATIAGDHELRII